VTNIFGNEEAPKTDPLRGGVTIFMNLVVTFVKLMTKRFWKGPKVIGGRANGTAVQFKLSELEKTLMLEVKKLTIAEAEERSRSIHRRS